MAYFNQRLNLVITHVTGAERYDERESRRPSII